MMRNLKVLGLALAAVFAVSAVAASMASADTFTAEKYPATLTGTQEENDVFTTTAGTLSCKKVTYHGLLTEASKQITLNPIYSECTGLGFPVVVDTNGCSYRFTQTDVAGDGQTTSRVDIVCPVGQEITVTAIGAGTTKCTIHIPAQVTLPHVEWKKIGEVGTTREITGTATISGLKYSHTAGTGLGACATGSSTTGAYHVKLLVTGEEVPPGIGHIGIFLS